MGSLVSYLTGGSGKTDDPDPVTGLTSRDRYILNTTWHRLSNGKANLETGMAIFLTLFERHPEYQDLFPFRNVTRSDLPTDDRFKAHCISVMCGLSGLVNNIDAPPILEHLLYRQGVNHVPRKVPREAYPQIKTLLLDLFSQSFNLEQLDAWKKFLDYGINVMLQGADSVAKNEL